MKRLFLIILLLLPVANSVAETSEIKLGVIAPLTGELAGYGSQIREGVDLAVEQLKLQGIEPVIIYEDACLPKQAVPSAQSLIRQKVSAVVGSYCVVGMSAVGPILNKSKIITLHTSVIPDSLTQIGKYLLSINILIKHEAFELAEIAYKEYGAKTASIVYWPGEWGLDYSKYFKERFEELGGKILTNDLTDPFQNDYKAEIMRIRSAKPDIIFPILVSNGLGTFIKQLRTLGVKSPIVSTNESEEQSVIDVAKEHAEGLFYLMPDKGESAESKQFQSKFKAKYKNLPTLLSKISYDSTIISATKLQACAGNTECALEAIYLVRDYNGASGNFSILNNSGAEKGFVRKQIQGQQFVVEKSKVS